MVDEHDASEVAHTLAADELGSMRRRHDELVRRLDSGAERAPRRAEPGLDAALDHAMSEFGSDELGRLSSSVEVKRPAKPWRSTSTDATQEALARDSDAVPSVFYAEQRRIGALLSSADGGSSALCYVLQALCVGRLCTTCSRTPKLSRRTRAWPSPTRCCTCSQCRTASRTCSSSSSSPPLRRRARAAQGGEDQDQRE